MIILDNPYWLSGAWLITAGTNSGVVKLVGEARHEHEIASGTDSEIVLLGITPWGLVKQREELVNENVCLYHFSKYLARNL